MGGQELVQCVVQRAAAIGGPELGLERIEHVQSQDAPCIEAVRVAAPLLDAGNRKPRRPRLERRAGLGTTPRPVAAGTVERVGPGKILVLAALDVFRWRGLAAGLVAE